MMRDKSHRRNGGDRITGREQGMKYGEDGTGQIIIIMITASRLWHGNKETEDAEESRHRGGGRKKEQN